MTQSLMHYISYLNLVSVIRSTDCMCNHRDAKNIVLIEERGTISFPWPIVYS